MKPVCDVRLGDKVLRKSAASGGTSSWGIVRTISWVGDDVWLYFRGVSRGDRYLLTERVLVLDGKRETP